jgi:hypothetical protein
VVNENLAMLSLSLRIIDLAVAAADSLTIRVLSLRREAYAVLFRTTQVLALLRVSILIRLAQLVAELLRCPAFARDRVTVEFLYGRAGQIHADLPTRPLSIVDNLALALRLVWLIAYASLLGIPIGQLSLLGLTFTALLRAAVVDALRGVVLVDRTQIVVEYVLCDCHSRQTETLTEPQDSQQSFACVHRSITSSSDSIRVLVADRQRSMGCPSVPELTRFLRSLDEFPPRP